MFKATSLTRATEDVIALKMRVVDEFIEAVIEPLASIGNPEKLIGKPYEQWTQGDMMALHNIYGEGLNKFIFNKEYKKLLKLESEV